MNYPHHVRVARDQGGTTDPNTGIYTPDLLVLYEGRADVQDEGAFFSMRVRASERVEGRGEGTAFLAGSVDGIAPGDMLAVDWDGQPPTGDPGDTWTDRDAAEVVKVVRLDDKLILEGLE